ncbi:unnamed protein product [Brugia pahangi]|uniref:Secreted protein n=1 Tax=Brugia pahangi TaxID=6280 RepID=A0A0N4SXC7_BRUPA|nr:unnamed protein product [Brugia pahangi]
MHSYLSFVSITTTATITTAAAIASTTTTGCIQVIIKDCGEKGGKVGGEVDGEREEGEVGGDWAMRALGSVSGHFQLPW